MLHIQRCSFLADHVNRGGKREAPPPHCCQINNLLAEPSFSQPPLSSSMSFPIIPGTGRSFPITATDIHTTATDPQSWPLTFMLVGHLLAARKVQTHQGAETEEKGEIQHEEDVLHGGDAGTGRGRGSLGPASLCMSGELEATSLPPDSRPLSSPGRKHQFFCRALSFPRPH